MGAILLIIGFLAMLVFALFGVVPGSVTLISRDDPRPLLRIKAVYKSTDISLIVGWISLATSFVPFVILFGGYVGLWWTIPCLTVLQYVLLGILLKRDGRWRRGFPPPNGAGVRTSPFAPVLSGADRNAFPE